MTMTEAPAAPAKLAFGAAFSATFRAVFGGFWSFFKAALLPLALSLLLAAVGFAVLANGEILPLLNLVLQILGMLPLVILGIAGSRLSLIGRRAGSIPRPLLGRRTLVYLGYTVLFGIIIALPAMVFAIAMLGDGVVMVGANPDDVELQAPALMHGAVLLLLVFYLVYLYFVTRLSLVFPAGAVDQKLGLGGSWRLTRGASGFKLYALLIVIVLLCLVGILVVTFVASTLVALLWVAPRFPAQPGDVDWITVAVSAAPMAIIGLLAEFLSFALIVVALASAYAQLTGWGSPRAEILERFE
jgi:hypothetical protein